MDALSLLTADHNRVRGLFSRFEAAHGADDETEMIELAGKIFTELDVHTTIEEEIFYPAIRGVDGEVAETVEESLQEHHVVKVLMEELGRVDGGSAEWVAKMQVLIENVEHHAGEEEQDLFPPLRRIMGARALDELAARLDARKHDLGAPTLADKLELTDDELRELAKEQEIPGRSKMDKEELAATVDA